MQGKKMMMDIITIHKLKQHLIMSWTLYVIGLVFLLISKHISFINNIYLI